MVVSQSILVQKYANLRTNAVTRCSAWHGSGGKPRIIALHQRSEDTLHGSWTFLQIHAGLNLASGGARMVVQVLK